jgi:hypothetical protein
MELSSEIHHNRRNICHHHHRIYVMELGHLLTRSGLTYPEVSSKVCHDSFCQLENSVSLPWVGTSLLYKIISFYKLFKFYSIF